MKIIKQYQGIFSAVVLLWLLAGWFAPQSGHDFAQVDFWLAWFCIMTFVSLPLIYLEVALSKRSQKPVLLGMQNLTREADASTRWRVASWLSMSLLILVGTGLVYTGAQAAQAAFQHSFSMTLPVIGVFSGFMVVAVLLSMASHVARTLAVIFGFLAVVLSGVFPAGTWQMTGLSFTEWQNAVVLAILASAVGFSIHWQSNLEASQPASKNSLQKTKASHIVLLIWIAQLLAALLFIVFGGIRGELSQMMLAAAALGVGGMLFGSVKNNMLKQANGIVVMVAVLAVSIALWHFVPMQTALLIVSLLAMLVCTLYAVFAGWHMKISHLRKALNFSSEGVYNLWRVAVRILVPLVILVTVVGKITQLV